MKAIRVAMMTAGLLAAATFAFAGPQGHAAVPHGQSGVQHGQAGQHGKAGQPHGNAGGGAQDRDRVRDQTHTPQSGADIATKISRNPKLQARLQAMLPSGMTLEQAASGFRNQGQFIAALEASKNNNIPFADLKAAMTGNPPLSLGQAIDKLKPAPTTGTGGDTEKPEPPETDKD